MRTKQVLTKAQTEKKIKLQHEIFECYQNGDSAKEISSKKNLSISTVENHAGELIKNAGAKNMTHAVAIAIHKGELKDFTKV